MTKRFPGTNKALAILVLAASFPSMATANELSALERLLRPLSQKLTAELARALITIQADVETQTRYEDLAGRHPEGKLTQEELAELEAIVRANSLLTVLKVEARAFLAQARPS